MARARKRFPEPAAPAPAPPDAGFALTFGQLLLPIVLTCALMVLDDYEFEGSGSGVWLLVKLLAPAALVTAIVLARALADRGGRPIAARLIRKLRLWLVLFAVLIGPLSLFCGSGYLVNLYNQRYGQASQAVAVIDRYDEVSGLKGACIERFSFRIGSGALNGDTVRTERPGDCPVYRGPRRFDGYSGRLADLRLRRSWIGVSVESMTPRPAPSQQGMR